MATGQRSAFLNAFGTEISSVLPVWVKSMFLGQPTAVPLRFDAQNGKIGKKRGIVSVPPSLLGSDPSGLKKVRRQNVDIYLPPTELLKREIDIPSKSRTKIERIVSLDTQQKTPFKASEIFTTVRIRAETTTGSSVEQWIARQDRIGAIKERLYALGLSVRRVYITEIETPALADFSSEIAPRAHLWRALNGFLGIAAIALLGIWFLAPTWTAHQTLAAQETQNTALSKRAFSLRTEVDAVQDSAGERTAFVNRVTRRQTLASVLRDLTVVLPDTVWLTDISLQNGRVVIRGSTAGSAAELVLFLTKDKRFLSPRLTGPVSQTTDGRERFDMTLDLKGHAL